MSELTPAQMIRAHEALMAYNLADDLLTLFMSKVNTIGEVKLIFRLKNCPDEEQEIAMGE